MKYSLKTFLFGVLIAHLSLPAYAEVYNLTGSLTYVSGENIGPGEFNITFTTTLGDVADVDGAAVTAISGTFFGSSIAGLSSYANANNKLYSSDNHYFDFSGISFLLSPALEKVWSIYDLDVVNMFYSNEVFASIGCSDCDNRFSMYRLSTMPTPVPEPETYAMFMVGLGLLGFASRKRKLR